MDMVYKYYLRKYASLKTNSLFVQLFMCLRVRNLQYCPLCAFKVYALLCTIKQWQSKIFLTFDPLAR